MGREREQATYFRNHDSETLFDIGDLCYRSTGVFKISPKYLATLIRAIVLLKFKNVQFRMVFLSDVIKKIGH